MFIGLDRDSGRSDAATPATRGDAEQALREFGAGDYATGTAGQADDTCDGLCPECAIEMALQEASERGLTPESPEFGEIFERIFNEANIGNGAKVTFLGAHKLSDEMPDELKAKLAEAGHPAFSDEFANIDPLAGFGILKDQPLRDEPVPSLLGDTALIPYLRPAEPMNSTTGEGYAGFDEEVFNEAFREIFGLPSGQRLPEPELSYTDEPECGDDVCDEERRGVVQDLTAAVLNLTEQLHEPGAEDTAAAIRDIAALAREIYDI